MMTIRLWRALWTSKGISPLYKRAFRAQRRSWMPEEEISPPTKNTPPIKRLIAIGIGLIVAWGSLVGLACLLPFAFIMLAAAGLYYGARFAIQTSIIITEERDHNTFDLLCVAPIGQFGICWSAFSGYMEQMPIMRLLYQFLRWLVIAVGTGIMFILSLSIISLAQNGQLQSLDHLINGVRQGVSVLGLLAVLYIHFTGSIVLGGLLGMWLPSFSVDHLEAPALATILYLVLQGLSYLLIYAIDFVILPIGLRDNFLLLCVQFVVFWLIRDMIIRGMWYWMIHRLQAGISDIQSALNPSMSTG